MSENSTHLIFSYGTLKRSEHNYEVMNIKEHGSSSFVGSGETVDKYPLVVGTKYNIPFMVKMENQGNNIVGEIFEIDNKMLEFLDSFEGHPNWYRRHEISIRMSADQNDQPVNPPETRKCWAYFLHKVDPELLEKEWLREFKATEKNTTPLAERLKRKEEFEGEIQTTNAVH